MTDERLAEIEKDIEDRNECYGVSSGTVLDLIQALRAERAKVAELQKQIEILNDTIDNMVEQRD